MEQYDVFSIDQMALGLSNPTFMRDECAFDTIEDPANETAVRDYLNEHKNTTLACWNAPEFKLTSKSGLSFNFLEYSGTQELVNDSNRLRIAIGAPKLSLYGISYGTNICGLYATVYSDYTDKLVLDSNDMSNSDLLQSAIDSAAGVQQVWDRLAYTCEV